MTLADELDRLIAALEADTIEYAVVGALAVAIWGAPRATKDIDLLIRPEALDQVMRLADGCGFRLPAGPMSFSDGMRVQRVSKVEGRVLLTLDLLLVNANLEPTWQQRVRVATERGALWTISRDALIAMKLQAARPQDVADVERMRELDR